MSATGGIATALDLVGAEGRVADDADQSDMFDADAAMPSMMSPAPVPKSGPNGGRPAGSRNKSTEQWRELFLSRFRHPLMALGELATRSPEQLARELGLYVWNEGKQVVGPKLDAHGRQVYDEDGKPMWVPVLATGDALKIQVDALKALLPYLAQKQPLEIKTPDGDQRGLFLVGDLNVQNNFMVGDGLPLPPEDEQKTIDVTPAKDET
jgi:hypothetical protein